MQLKEILENCEWLMQTDLIYITGKVPITKLRKNVFYIWHLFHYIFLWRIRILSCTLKGPIVFVNLAYK